MNSAIGRGNWHLDGRWRHEPYSAQIRDRRTLRSNTFSGDESVVLQSCPTTSRELQFHPIHKMALRNSHMKSAKASYPTSTSTTATAANHLATKTKSTTSLESAFRYERGGSVVSLEASLL